MESKNLSSIWTPYILTNSTMHPPLPHKFNSSEGGNRGNIES